MSLSVSLLCFTHTHSESLFISCWSVVEMLCYWGAQVRKGFGLTDSVNHVNDDIRCVCPKSEIQDMSAGRCFVGFIRDGKVSILKMRGDPDGHDGKLKPLTLEKVRSINCSGSDAVLLSHKGKVYIYNMSTKCSLLKGLADRHVIQIACGDQHSIALTQNGHVFVWGGNSHGQLGVGERLGSNVTPQRILDGLPLAQISAGGDHSFVLSLSGVVFGWGKNSSGQLGLGDTTDRHEPTVVNSLNGKKIHFISCGGKHTAALSKEGLVFTFGSGEFGQLGHNSFQDEHLPREIAELWGSKVTCGRHHTLVLVASPKPQMYSFGCGKQGQLGNGQTINQSVPLPVDLPTELIDGYAVGKLIAGENHSFALFYKVPENESTNPKPDQSSGIVTLDEKMIDQWVSECDTKSWKTIKKEINEVFLSPASLNGSFLKTSCEEHYQTSVELSGLDLDLVKKSFAKLSVNERVMSEVVKVVRDTLLPSYEPNPSSVEALRVYLLLPELTRVCQEQHRVELLEAFAPKILQLKPDAVKVLEKYWSTLPDDCLKGMVKFCSKKSAELIDMICFGEMNQDELTCLESYLKVLEVVYKVCCSTNSDIKSRDFIIHKVNDLLDTLQTTLEEILRFESELWYMCDDTEELLDLKDHYIKIIEMLVNYPFVVDTATKQRIFTILRNPSALCCTLNVNRQSVLKDTLQYLEQGNYSFHLPLKVKFVAENGIDAGGLSAEFFSLLSQSFLTWEKKLLDVNENSPVWFNSEHAHKEDFYSFGNVCGMALFNRQYMNIDFPLALFKKLLNQSVTLNDLKEISPEVARGLKDLLEMEEEAVETLFLDFTVRDQELVPNGADIPVTKNNRQEYVDLYVDFILNKSVMNQFEQFSAGFSEGCPVNAWTMFHPEELRELFHGSPVYDWEDLPKCATYEHCSASDELISNFWTVFFELSEENKQRFLVFMYGTNRLSKLTLLIVQLNLPDSDDRFPEAQTCFSTLKLPNYSNIDTLRNKLKCAISVCEVFGRE